jgi:Uma2 family endonuclease
MAILAPNHLAALPRRRWTREMYHDALEAGLFSEDDKIELIGGEIVEKMAPQKSTHSWSIGAGERELERLFGKGHWVRVQLPLELGKDSDPEPDLAVVVGELDDYKYKHPSTSVLVVEIADASLHFDQMYKASLYASAGIQDYWIVNLVENVLEVYRDPQPDGEAPFGHTYMTVERLTANQTIIPLAGSVAIPVRKLLP